MNMQTHTHQSSVLSLKYCVNVEGGGGDLQSNMLVFVLSPQYKLTVNALCIQSSSDWYDAVWSQYERIQLQANQTLVEWASSSCLLGQSWMMFPQC